MIDMGMREEDEKRALLFRPALRHHLHELFCLCGKAAGIDQDDGIRCLDEIRV